MGKPKISVAIATFNEEENIKDCLESVQWADEIVVVDGSSQDDTVAIAKKHGAQVIVTDNPLANASLYLKIISRTFSIYLS